MTDEIYGQLEYTFDNEYVRDTDTKELIFSPTPVVATTFDAYVPSLNGEAPKTNIRILYDGGEQTCGSWDLIEYGTTGELGITTYPMLGHFDDALTPTFDINFATCDYYYYSPSTLTANNLYNLYWRRTVNQINVGKMLVAYFHLTEADIQTLKRISETSRVVVPTSVTEGLSTIDNSYLEAFSAPRILMTICSKLSKAAALLKYATQAVMV